MSKSENTDRLNAGTNRSPFPALGFLATLLQGVAFLTFFTVWLIARVHVQPDADGVPLPQTVIRYTILTIFASAVPALLGLGLDRRKLLALFALILIFPLLAFMGVLAGHF